MEISARGRHVSTPTDGFFLVQAINDYIGRSKFPKKLELKRIKATKAYYDEKVQQHTKVMNDANHEIDKVDLQITTIKHQCQGYLTRLRMEIEK